MRSLLAYNPTGRFQALSAPVRGALWMCLAALVFAFLNAVIRIGADQGLHPFQIAFLRSFFGLGFMLPWLIRMGVRSLHTRRPLIYAFRGAAATGAMICWMTSIAEIPLAEATAITFAAPLLATIGSALILGETVRLRRWSAIIIGFVGVLIILRPGASIVQPGAIWALGAAGLFSVNALVLKSMTRTEDPQQIVAWTAILLSLTTFPLALTEWVPMTADAWMLAVALGLLGTVGHLCMTRSFASADASFVMPFDYARLPFVAVVGFVLFAEAPDYWTWTGAIVITGAALDVARREAQLAKQLTRTQPD